MARMTRQEAEAIAVEALGYVLENDVEYMEEDWTDGPAIVKKWEKALEILQGA